MRHLRLAAAVTPLLFVVACGSGPSTAPSPAADGATINGSFVSAGTGGVGIQAYRPSAVATPSGLTVSVAGTSLSAPVDGSGRFSLSGVPSGDRQLKFSGSGFESTLDLGGVQPSEVITLDVSLTESSVELESSRRATGGSVDVEGRVTALPPETSAGHFRVGTTDVETSATTRFLLGSGETTFDALVPGVRVHVKGEPTATGVLASVVDVQNTNETLPVEINGVVDEFDGTADSFEFEIDGRLIKGDALTEFFGNSAFDDLEDGVRAEVKGRQANGYVYAVRLHVNVEDATDDDDGQDDSASIEGPLQSISGTAPLLTLNVGGTTVRTSSATEVRRRGDVQDLDVLAIGMTLHVVGDRKPDGSIDARMLQIKDDEVGAEFEIEGSVGGLKGTCPAVSFGVNGYTIVADAATTFAPAPGCSALKNGQKVKVKGIVLAGGLVQASEITRK